MSKVVFITGSSTGFGRESAERFARRGHRVFATMRQSDGRNAVHRKALEQLAATEQLPIEVLDLDVTDEESVRRAVEQALDRAGRLDVVINNAGCAGLGITEAFTPTQFETIFDVNVHGVVRVNRAALPAMRRQGSGLLIHVSSVGGRFVVPAMAAYCASKHALEALADAYRYELRPFGIDSILVEPGIYRTPIFETYFRAADEERSAEYGPAGACAGRVLGVFQAALNQPDAPGPQPVAEAFIKLAELPFGKRPFRTVVGPAMEQLLEQYNDAAEQLRPVVAGFFNVSELMKFPNATDSAAGA